MKVLQLLPRMHPGGAERGAIDVAEGLIQSGHEAIVASAGGPWVHQLTEIGAEHITLPIADKSLTSLRAVRPLRNLIKGRRIDIVHNRSRLPGWIERLALRKLPTAYWPKRISTVHGLNSVNKYSNIMTWADRIIAVSDTVSEYIQHHYACDPQKIEVITRGIDTDHFRTDLTPPPEWLERWQQQYPQLKGRQIIALIGRINRRGKGHADFIEVMRRCIDRGKSIHGLIVGSAEDDAALARLHDQVRENNLSDHISFTGRRDDVANIIHQCDLIMVPSHKPESFGRVVIEALACGVPVAGYAHGGVGESLKKYYPAGCADAINIDSLTSITETLLTEPPSITPFQAGTTKEMVAKTLAVYEKVLQQP